MRDEEPICDRGYGYGASWWTFPKNDGLVIPSRRIVIVRRGFDGNAMNFDLDAFTRDVLATLS